MSWHRIAGESEIRDGIFYEFDDKCKIGEGGMGVVYLGRRVDSYGKETKVAIKKISAGIDPKSSEMARARREASIRIKHENLLYMYGMVTSTQKDFLGNLIEENYIVMEYLDGIELVDFIDGHLASGKNFVSENLKVLYSRYLNDRLAVSAEIIRDVLSALSAMHDAGYIHRDIDPRNVFITVDGTVKLIDFGLCKPLLNVSDIFNLSQANLHKQLSSSGQLMGKPSYSSPELLSGQLTKQDRTTDIYSVGMLYYQLVTGKVPFEEEGDFGGIIEAQKKKNLILTSIPDKKVSAIIAKATRKETRRRFQTCSEFRVALEGGRPTVQIDKSIVVISIAALALLLLSILTVKKFDTLETWFADIIKKDNVVSKPSLSALCDSLAFQISRQERVDTSIIRAVKDSVLMKELYADVTWNKLTDSALFFTKGILLLHFEYKAYNEFKIFDFDSPDEIPELFEKNKSYFSIYLKGKPFSLSALDTLYTPKNEYLPALLSEIFLDDMVEFPQKYGEDKFLFLFFSRFEWMTGHIGMDEQINDWFKRVNHILVMSESYHWERASRLKKSDRYIKIKNNLL